MKLLAAQSKTRFNPALLATDDAAMRSPEIRWPEGFTPEDAELFAHNEIFIRAPRLRVWQHIIEAPKWPQWYPNAQDARIATGRLDVLQKGTRFAFDTLGLHIDGRVAEFIPESRLGWFGHGRGIDAYHAWLLIEFAGGCLVATEKVAKGATAVALRTADPDAIHKGHDLWLSTLKTISER
jgi:hypothetical protein